MKRTPALVAAAAALGLLSGLGIEARAGALTGEVSPHTVDVAWLTPGAPSPDGSAELPARLHAHRQVVAQGQECARTRSEPSALDLRRS